MVEIAALVEEAFLPLDPVARVGWDRSCHAAIMGLGETISQTKQELLDMLAGALLELCSMEAEEPKLDDEWVMPPTEGVLTQELAVHEVIYPRRKRARAPNRGQWSLPAADALEAASAEAKAANPWGMTLLD